MFDTARLFRDETESLMNALSISPAPWWSEVPRVFSFELGDPVQLQLRLDASFIAVIVRSHLPSMRTKLYGLLKHGGLDFAVATRCEALAKRFPDVPWTAKLAVTGGDVHAKLTLDHRLKYDDIGGVFEALGLSPALGERAAEKLLTAVGGNTLRQITIASGRPVRVELYASRPPEPGGAATTLDALGDRLELLEDPEFLMLREVHGTVSRFGRQRYTVGVDGSGLRPGLKVSYADVPVSVLMTAVAPLSQAPAMTVRRLKVSSQKLGIQLPDHISFRLRPDRPAHITVYFNRLYAQVA